MNTETGQIVSLPMDPEQRERWLAGNPGFVPVSERVATIVRAGQDALNRAGRRAAARERRRKLR